MTTEPRPLQLIKYALENRAGLFPEEVNREALREAGCLERVCVLPAHLNERLSYLGNVLVQATYDQPKGDDRLRACVNTLCQAVTHLFNSCSWREGVLHDFDELELTQKLRRFANAALIARAPELAARVEELEAENMRLKDLCESDRVRFCSLTTERLTADNARLRELLRECVEFLPMALQATVYEELGQ